LFGGAKGNILISGVFVVVSDDKVQFINSSNNEKIKHVSKILRYSKYRKLYGQFVIEGFRLLKEAVRCGIKIADVFCCESERDKCLDTVNFIRENTSEPAPKIFIVSEKVLKKISSMPAPQPIVCLCNSGKNEKVFDESRLLPSSDVFKSDKIVILENIQNPKNLGAVLRVCDAFGVKSVIMAGSFCDIYAPDLIRGSMGSIFRLDIITISNIFSFIENLKLNKFKVLASAVSGDARRIQDIDFGNKTALVIGNEGTGVTREVMDMCDERVVIPMAGKAESLNVAAASAIMVWEITGRGGA
jgi:TrmH family RNA methyltransferase